MRVNLLTAVAAATFCQADIGVAQDVIPDTEAPAQDPRLASPGRTVRTLQQALAQTYQTSPTLMAQRAELRGLDSDVALARAAGHPQIIVGANASKELYTTRKIGSLGRSLSANADVEQVLFAGGRIRNSVRGAETEVIAGRADLRATEGDVFTEAVAAYADLLRDRDIRGFNLDQVRVLEANLKSTRSRFNVGDVTRADVAQSEARLEKARSDLATAEGRLQFSEENFERVVGARAGMLEPLPSLPPLPPTADQAVEAALADNPVLAAFVARARAARYEVAATKAERLPTISAVNSTGYTNALGSADKAVGLPNGTLPNSSTNVAAGLSLRLPLYQGGAASARVRRAEEATNKLQEQATAAERLAVANARANFVIWRKALSAITSDEAAVASNKQSLESVKIEQVVGARSVLDVLNAEKELLDSRIALASSRRDAYVAAFELLNVMGAAEAAQLNLEAGPLYDPRANYRAYARTWSDWADGPRRTAVSTRTVPEEVNSPLTRLKSGTPNEFEKPGPQLIRGTPTSNPRAGWQSTTLPEAKPETKPEAIDAGRAARLGLAAPAAPGTTVAAAAPKFVAPVAALAATAPAVVIAAAPPPAAVDAAPIVAVSETAIAAAALAPAVADAEPVATAPETAVAAALPATAAVDPAPVVAAPETAIAAAVPAPAAVDPAPVVAVDPAPVVAAPETAIAAATPAPAAADAAPVVAAPETAVALAAPVPAVAVAAPDVPAPETAVAVAAPAPGVVIAAPVVAVPAVVATNASPKLAAPATVVPASAVEPAVVQPAAVVEAAVVPKPATVANGSAAVPTTEPTPSRPAVLTDAVKPAGVPAVSPVARVSRIGRPAGRGNLVRNHPARGQRGGDRNRWVVQLGAYSSAARIEAGWQGAVRHYNPLDHYVPVSGAHKMQRATLHRLAIGRFPTRAAARSVCLAIKARGADCFIRETAGDTPLQWALRTKRSRTPRLDQRLN